MWWEGKCCLHKLFTILNGQLFPLYKVKMKRVDALSYCLLFAGNEIHNMMHKVTINYIIILRLSSFKLIPLMAHDVIPCVCVSVWIIHILIWISCFAWSHLPILLKYSFENSFANGWCNVWIYTFAAFTFHLPFLTILNPKKVFEYIIEAAAKKKHDTNGLVWWICFLI